MEDALRGMNRKLIDAHEEERTRIARELHDDIGQRLGLLMLSLDRLGADAITTLVRLAFRSDHRQRC